MGSSSTSTNDPESGYRLWATRPGADQTRALFLNRKDGERLTARAASAIFKAIAEAAGLDDNIIAHVGRHTFGAELVRGGEDFVTVAEMPGHARLENARIYTPAHRRRQAQRTPASHR